MALRTCTAAKMPSMIYGTAWKKDRSHDLVREAILAGFRGVDTAAQPKHYQEDLVGRGLREGIREAGLKRTDVYVQTKFTSVHGQDPKKMPYDPRSSVAEQVNASVASSLRNLGSVTDDSAVDPYVDCLVLHSPYPEQTQTQEAWRAMETLVPNSARTLGVSNIYHLPLLRSLYDFATIKPSVVQNRFYRDTGYDFEIRAFCVEKGIQYQSFWTLSANPNLWQSQPVMHLAESSGVSPAVALYALVMGLGNISILNGTTNLKRMIEDLEGMQKVDAWMSLHEGDWKSVRSKFDELLIKV